MFKRFNYRTVIECASLSNILALVNCLTGVVIVILSVILNFKLEDIGFATFGASLLYFLFKRREYKATERFTNFRIYSLGIIFWSFFYVLSLILIFYSLYERPLYYFIIIGFISGLAGLLIVTYDYKERLSWAPYIFLIILILTSLNIKLCIIYEFPFPYFLGEDIQLHSLLAQYIVENGNTHYPISLHAGKYKDYPVWHILAAIGSIILSANIKDSIVLTIVLSFVLIPILILYIVLRNITKASVGLLASLIVAIADVFIVRGATGIGISTLTISYFTVLIYLLLLKTRQAKISSITLAAIISLVIVLSHPLSNFIVLTVLFSFFFAKWAYNILIGDKCYDFHISPLFFIFFLVTTWVYWMHTVTYRPEGDLFGMIIKVFTSAIKASEYSPAPYVGYFGSYSRISNYLYHPGYIILHFFGIYGMLCWVKEKISCKKFIIFVCLVFLFSATYAIPLTPLKNYLLSHRWIFFLYIFLIPMSAYGLLEMYQKISGKKMLIVFSFISIFLLTFLMITTPFVCKDKPLYNKERVVRDGFYLSERQAAVTISHITNDAIWVDSVYDRAFRGTNACIKKIVQDEYDLSGIIVLRNYLKDYPVPVSRAVSIGVGKFELLGKKFLRAFENPHYNKIYTNGEVFAYRHV